MRLCWTHLCCKSLYSGIERQCNLTPERPFTFPLHKISIISQKTPVFRCLSEFYFLWWNRLVKNKLMIKSWIGLTKHWKTFHRCTKKQYDELRIVLSAHITKIELKHFWDLIICLVSCQSESNAYLSTSHSSVFTHFPWHISFFQCIAALQTMFFI